MFFVAQGYYPCLFHVLVSRFAWCLATTVFGFSSVHAGGALITQQGKQVQEKKDRLEELKREKEELERKRKAAEEDLGRIKGDNSRAKQSKSLSDKAEEFVESFVDRKFLKCGNTFYARLESEEKRSSLRSYCTYKIEGLKGEGLSIKNKGDLIGEEHYNGEMTITAGGYTAYCWMVGGHGAYQSSQVMETKQFPRFREFVYYTNFRGKWSINDSLEYHFLDAPYSCQAPIEGPPRSRSTQDENNRPPENNRLPSSRFGLPSLPSRPTEENRRIEDEYNTSSNAGLRSTGKSNIPLVSKIKGTWEFYWSQNEENDASRIVILEVGDDKITLKASGDELVEQVMSAEKHDGDEMLLKGSNPRVVNEPSFDGGFPAPGYTPDQILLQRQPNSNPKVSIRDNVNVKEWQPVQVNKSSTQKDSAGNEVFVIETSYKEQSGSLIFNDNKIIYRQFSRYNNTQKMNVKEVDGMVYLTGYDVLISESSYRPFRYTADQLRFRPKSDGTFEVETRDGVNVKDWVPVRLKSHKAR